VRVGLDDFQLLPHHAVNLQLVDLLGKDSNGGHGVPQRGVLLEHVVVEVVREWVRLVRLLQLLLQLPNAILEWLSPQIVRVGESKVSAFTSLFSKKGLPETRR